MTTTETIVEQALRLPRGSRAFLAEKLLESLDCDEGFDVSSEWMREIRRRCKDLDQGDVDLIPADRVFDDIDRQIT
jgi:putative addiction module component (TIGR02574 family)